MNILAVEIATPFTGAASIVGTRCAARYLRNLPSGESTTVPPLTPLVPQPSLLENFASLSAPPLCPAAVAARSTKTAKKSPFKNRPWWSVPVLAQEQEQVGQDKSHKIPESLERSASSSHDDLGRDLQAQDEEEEPTTSGELQQPTQQEQQQPQDETCLSSSGASFPSRQPDTWPSQYPFKTAQFVELSEIPESPSLGATMHHQPHLSDRTKRRRHNAAGW